MTALPTLASPRAGRRVQPRLPIWIYQSRRVRLAFLGLLLAFAPAWADKARRVLHVSLYPYIPDAAAAALTLKQGFERSHPDVIVEMSFNQHYYSLDPAERGLLFEDSDVHEVDSVLLRDVLDQHRLAPLPPALARSLGDLVPLARQAATQDGRLVAVPHWMCADFLIYRADKSELASAPTLTDLERALGREHGLLIDMKGADTLGELYLSALLPRRASPEASLSNLTPTPDLAILARLRRMLALAPAGFGRNADYDMRGGFYARQFARRAGSAYVGYSETLHAVLDETATSCLIEDRCLTARDVRVAPMPFQDNAVRPAVWVDMFGIDARVHGQTLADAQTFVTYAVSAPAYRALLIPHGGEAPRYLLPAFQATYQDRDILEAAPLYTHFRGIIDQGAVVTAPGLTARLHKVAAHIDAALPQAH